MGIYREGKIIGMLEGGFHDGGHHTAVACDANQVFAVAEESGSVGLLRFSPDGYHGRTAGTSFRCQEPNGQVP